MASNTKPHRTTPIAIWGTAIILVGLGIYAVHSLTAERVEVHSAKVIYTDLVKTIATNGKAEPVDDFQAKAEAPGVIQAIYVDPLQKVKAGQLLLRLDDSAAQATLAHARSSLETAELNAANIEHGGTQEERSSSTTELSRANLQREQDETALQTAQKLLAQGAASPAEVAAAQHRLQIDDNAIQSIQQRGSQRFGQGDVASALAQVADAKAGISAAEAALANLDIRSPYNGTVYYLPVAEHDSVASNDDLAYVADLSHMRVTAYFDEPDVGSLADGQQVAITWEAKPGKIWHGHISQIPTTIITYGSTRNVGECFITVDDADSDLDPNATVNVRVTIARHPHVLTIPHESLHFDGPQAYVFRIVDGKLVRTNVQAGLVDLNDVEVASGLSEGDVVARTATSDQELRDGLRVTAVP